VLCTVVSFAVEKIGSVEIVVVWAVCESDEGVVLCFKILLTNDDCALLDALVFVMEKIAFVKSK
jgi:hypothetical protein